MSIKITSLGLLCKNLVYKAIAAAANFKVDPAVAVCTCELVFLNEFSRDVCDFDTAENAISYALLKFDGEELNFNIKSLESMRFEEKNNIRNEVIEKTNSILNDYKDLVMRFWDLYDEMEQEEQDLINKLGADKWFKYAFTLSLDELWHEAGNWQIVKEDLKDEKEGE